MQLTAAEQITPGHRERLAYIYVRQSTARQVQQHRESQVNQYALVERAGALGWAADRIRVIDADLGQSGQDGGRAGFQELVAEVSLGHVGIVLAYEASRLARNNTDWYTLLDLATVAGALIAGADGVYDPRDYNDRLLLGLRGMFSEAELHLLRLRLAAGRARQAEQLLGRRDGLTPQHPPLGLDDDPVDEREDLVESVGQPLPLLRVGRPQRGRHARTLPSAGPGDVDQLRICALQALGGLLALAAGDAVELLREPPDAAGPRPEDLRWEVGRVAEHTPRPAQQATDDAYAIAEGLAVGRAPDGRLHHGAVDAQPPPARDARGPGQGDHPVVERRDRLGADAPGPADQCGVIRDRLQIDPAELAQDQAVAHETLDLGIAPAVQSAHEQQPQDDLDRRGGPPARRRPGIPRGEVGPHALVQVVVVQQRIEPREHRVEGQGGRRHQGAEILRGIAVAQHRAPPATDTRTQPPTCGRTRARTPKISPISHRELVLVKAIIPNRMGNWAIHRLQQRADGVTAPYGVHATPPLACSSLASVARDPPHCNSAPSTLPWGATGRAWHE